MPLVMLALPLAYGAPLGAAFPRRSFLAPQSRPHRAPPARSLVVPPLLGRGDLGAAVLDRDPAQRVVLALRVALPVVRHLDPGQRGMPVEDDAEEIPRLPLVPVARRVHADQ